MAITHSGNAKPGDFRAAEAFALNPPSGVRFTPVPFKLLRVHEAWTETERVHPDMGNEWAFVPFDPWRKGDLVVIGKRTKISYQPGHTGPAEMQSWFVVYRHTTPAAAKPKVAGSRKEGCPTIEARPYELWRIPFRWRSAAESLVGSEYESREALEAAMEGAVLSVAAE